MRDGNSSLLSATHFPTIWVRAGSSSVASNGPAFLRPPASDSRHACPLAHKQTRLVRRLDLHCVLIPPSASYASNELQLLMNFLSLNTTVCSPAAVCLRNIRPFIRLECTIAVDEV